MQLVFIFGQAGVGKLTVGRELQRRAGIALFHNHLVVDAVGAVFPFGSEAFIKLRERFWLDVFDAAATANRSLIFTFAPESTVAADFPERVQRLVEDRGGRVHFVRLVVAEDEQERRISAPGRTAFGKLTSLDLLRTLRPQFEAALAAMPTPLITIDTGIVQPRVAADIIADAVGLIARVQTD